MLGRRDLQSRGILLSLYAMDSVRGIAILPPHCQSVKTTDKVRFTHLVGYAFPTGNSWYSPGVPNLEPESGVLCVLGGWSAIRTLEPRFSSSVRNRSPSVKPKSAIQITANDSVRENGGGLCRDATMLRDSPAGLIEPMVCSAGVTLARCVQR